MIDAELRTSKDVSLTCVVAAIAAPGPRFAKGKVVATGADGSARTVPLPLEKKGLGTAIRAAAWVDGEGRQTTIAIDPPRDVPSDGAARVVLAAGTFKPDAPSKTVITIDFSADLAWFALPDRLPIETGSDAWFPFAADAYFVKPSETGREDWIAAPAGKRGRIARRDDALIYDGKPPVVMEPVKARIAIRKAGPPTVFLLDHNGRRTPKTLPVTDGASEIDGARDRTCYYLVEYPE